ncbi:MAG: hypothetical protein SVZ03_03215 [Spirochaetota bacterium]|nr:hypothetical protein [Spirochaetota bacterium]
MKRHVNIIIIILFLSYIACGNSNEGNKVSIEQINSDNSNNYRYIFRKSISNDRLREKRNKRDAFKD